MELRPIKVRRISEEIIAQIEQLVAEGLLSPGDRLPSERELAERLSVSRGAVREALSALEMMGILDVRPGDGTFIRKTSMDSVIRPLSLMLLLEQEIFLDIFEVRRILEAASARLAAKRASDEDLERMAAFLKDMEQDLEQGRFSQRPDMNFHYAVAKASGNSLLFRLMNTISGNVIKVLNKTWPRRFTSVEQGRKVLEEHLRIYEAIKARDAELAERRMKEHLDRVEEALHEEEAKSG